MEKVNDILTGNISKSVMIAVAVLLIGGLIKLLEKRIKSEGKKKTYYIVLYDSIKYIVIVVGVLTILSLNGFNIGGLIAGLGIAGAIAGIALQDLVKDIIMGLQITADGFYYVGDAVIYDDKECIVTDFNLRSTKIRVIADGSSIVLCNRLVDKIHRMSNIIDVFIPAPYDVPADVMRTLCREIADKVRNLPGVDSATFKGTERFEDSCIRYMLRFMAHPSKKCDLLRTVNGIVQDEFAKAGVNIPYNQMDIHIIDTPKMD